AAGVAHEIGNPITGIACLAQNLREERDEDAEIIEMSSQILEQTKRVSRIVQSLMSFSHSGQQQHDNHEPVSLFDTSAEAMHLLSLNKLSKAVNFFNLCNPQHLVLGDAQRLAQVLINLLSNARDASPEQGHIYIRTTATLSHVELSIEDQGTGISTANLEHLFEPFFTTKDPGQGTGLGLALVYSIIEEHHGEIHVDSPSDTEHQRGTRFRITLPRHVPTSSPVVSGLL
nr:HAMP domain-containing histidine kinase [Thiopseudomonas sp.]